MHVRLTLVLKHPECWGVDTAEPAGKAPLIQEPDYTLSLFTSFFFIQMQQFLHIRKGIYKESRHIYPVDPQIH